MNVPMYCDWCRWLQHDQTQGLAALVRFNIAAYQVRQAVVQMDAGLKAEGFAAAITHAISAAECLGEHMAMCLSATWDEVQYMPAALDGIDWQDLLTSVLGALQMHVYRYTNQPGQQRWERSKQLAGRTSTMVRACLRHIPMNLRREAFTHVMDQLTKMEHRR